MGIKEVGSFVFDFAKFLIEDSMTTPEEKQKKEEERKQQERHAQWQKESAQRQKELDEKRDRENKLIEQVFCEVQKQVGSQTFKRILKEEKCSHGKEWNGKVLRSYRYVVIKDGVNAIIDSSDVAFDVQDWMRILAVVTNDSFYQFSEKFSSMPDISFLSSLRFRGDLIFRGDITEEQYKDMILSYVQEKEIGKSVDLVKLSMVRGESPFIGYANIYLSVSIVELANWVATTQKNLSHILDLFNQYCAGELTDERQTILSCPDGRSVVAEVAGSKIQRTENTTTEFKSSLVFSPDNNLPSSEQVTKIAQEIAGFMNTDGGDLFLGISDKGYVVGIQNDLAHLQEAVICGQNERTDQDYTYRPTHDGYCQKLQNIARFYLGEVAAKLLDDPEFIHDDPSNLYYVKVHVNPSREKLVYCGKYEDVYIRSGTSVVRLKGAEREDYVSRRFKRN